MSVLCLGAHSDDIEIGAGGTILSWIAAGVRLDVRWCVLQRGRAARGRGRGRRPTPSSQGAADRQIEVADVRGRLLPLPGQSHQALADRGAQRGVAPDVVLTHRRDDAHQDHREVSQLTWNVFRDHLILEYEIPKWDGDLGQPNVYMPLTHGDAGAQESRCSTSISAPSGPRTGSTQRRSAAWRGCAAWRCRRRERYAEAFVMSKAVLA